MRKDSCSGSEPQDMRWVQARMGMRWVQVLRSKLIAAQSDKLT